MNIEEIKKQCVIALFSNKDLKNQLVLKGGTALSLSEHIYYRLSTDIDFSIPGNIASPEQYFANIEKCLLQRFRKFKLELFDFKKEKKPKIKSPKKPPTWGGWGIHFKLISEKSSNMEITKKRRTALIPKGLNSSIISIDISEYEYCALTKIIRLENVAIRVYDPAILIIEKLRAICQQHPLYPHNTNIKTRSRDFYDIYHLLKRHRSDKFVVTLKKHLEPVFKIKDVSLDIIPNIFKAEFLELQKSGFEEVKNTISNDKIEPFDFYLEQLKLLILDMGISL